jgi:hypothetical protein
MRSAAIRALLLIGLVLGGLWSAAAAAGQQLDPIGTVTSAISTIAAQTTVVSDLTGNATGSGSASGAVDAVSEATDGAGGSVLSADSLTAGGSSSGGSGSSDGGSGSGSASSDGSSQSATRSNPGSPHTRFDRLPRRYETLLERIESGRHVRANIARLRALLASASPQVRTRVMRLIRLEIRRLQRGGLNRRERAAVQRLRGLLAKLGAPATSRHPGSPMPAASVQGSGVLAEVASGRDAPASASGSGSRPSGSPDTGRAGVGGLIPALPLPPAPPSGPPYWPLLILAAIAGLLLLLSRGGRQFLPAPVRGLIEVRQPDVWALAAAVGFGLLAGLLVVLLVQAAQL